MNSSVKSIGLTNKRDIPDFGPMSTSSRHLKIVAAVLFMLTYILLCYFDRPASDDYHFMTLLHEQGLVGALASEYQSWSSRYTSLLVSLSFYRLQDVTGLGSFGFGLISLGLILSGLHRLMTSIAMAGSSPARHSWSWSHTVMLCIVLFFSTYDIGESWFWICSSSTYLWSGAALLHLMASLIGRGRAVSRWSIGVLSAIYIGGSLGPLALLVILSLVLALLMGRMERWKSLSFEADRPLILISSIVCGISFAILYIAPGNRIREGFFEEVSIGWALVLNIPYSGAIGLLRVPRMLLPALLLSLPLAMPFLPATTLDKSGRWRRTGLSTLAYLGLIFLYQLPITYKTHGLAADRALFFVSMLTVAYAIALWIIWLPVVGQRWRNSSVKISLGLMVVVCVASLLWVITVERDYASAHDSRTSVLENPENEYLIILDPLPTTFFYHSAEISRDSTHHTNTKLKKAFDLHRAPILSGPSSPYRPSD